MERFTGGTIFRGGFRFIPPPPAEDEVSRDELCRGARRISRTYWGGGLEMVGFGRSLIGDLEATVLRSKYSVLVFCWVWTFVFVLFFYVRV